MAAQHSFKHMKLEQAADGVALVTFARPEVKNSEVLVPARRARKTAGRNDTTIDTRTMTQSRVTNCIG